MACRWLVVIHCTAHQTKKLSGDSLMMNRRRFLATLAVAGASPFPTLANAANGAFPTKPVTLVVPNPPGGASDVMARLIGTGLSQMWGQPVVVENRAGAGGSIGAEYVARSAGDGYTLLMGGIASHAINPALYKNIKYDPLRDFTALTLVGTLANVLLAHPSFPADNVRQMIELVRANPNKYSYASVGNGTSPHLSGELFCEMTGLKMVHVPYKGSAAALNDLLAGQIQLGFDNLSAGIPFIKDKKLKALAVTTKSRSPLLPSVPTIAESGVPGYDLTSWAGLFAPARLPAAVAQKISTDVATILRKPDVAEKLLTLGVTAAPNTPTEFAAFLTSEVNKYRSLSQKANLHIG